MCKAGDVSLALTLLEKKGFENPDEAFFKGPDNYSLLKLEEKSS